MTTKEDRKQMFLKRYNKAVEGLKTDDLYDYIDGLKYALAFCLQYKKSLYDIISKATFTNPFREVLKDPTCEATTPLDKCLKSGILKPWKDTYWFDKEKAAALQEYITEQRLIREGV